MGAAFCRLVLLGFWSWLFSVTMWIFLCCRFLTQYKEVYERDVKCQVKMLHNSGSAGSQLSPSRENEVRHLEVDMSFSAWLNKFQKWLIIDLCARYRKWVPKQMPCEFYDIHAWSKISPFWWLFVVYAGWWFLSAGPVFGFRKGCQTQTSSYQTASRLSLRLLRWDKLNVWCSVCDVHALYTVCSWDGNSSLE